MGSFIHDFAHHMVVHASKDPMGTATTIAAVATNPVTWGIAAAVGATYLIVKACK